MPRHAQSLTRRRILEWVRRRHIDPGFPRLQMFAILVASGLAALLTSVLMLQAGLTRMGVRYGLAVLAGYSVFLLCIRLWIAWQRGQRRWDIIDLPDIDVSGPGKKAAVDLFTGGRSGGAGGGASWATVADATGGTAKQTGGGELVSDAGTSASALLDADEFWPLVMAGMCALGGAMALGYVVYMAEVAVDAAVVTTAYKRLRRTGDARLWIGSAFRQTWKPGLVIAATAMAAGFALQTIDPAADSIGDIVRAITD